MRKPIERPPGRGGSMRSTRRSERRARASCRCSAVRVAPEAHHRLPHHRGESTYRVGPACSSPGPVAVRSHGSRPCATDPEIRDELVATVRRFVEREVLPVARELEHADEYPAAIVEQMKATRAVRGHDPRGVRRPRARPPRPTSAVVEELAYGLDVAVGHRQHAHDRREPAHARTAPTSSSARWLPRLATRRAARLPLAVGVRRRAATPATSRAGPCATATST